MILVKFVFASLLVLSVLLDFICIFVSPVSIQQSSNSQNSLCCILNLLSVGIIQWGRWFGGAKLLGDVLHFVKLAPSFPLSYSESERNCVWTMMFCICKGLRRKRNDALALSHYLVLRLSSSPLTPL